MEREIVYVGHDNTQDFILRAENDQGVMEAQPLTAVTSMTLTVGGKLVASTNKLAGPIRWDNPGFEVGEIHLVLGEVAGLPPGIWDCPLVLYDPNKPLGLVWGLLPLTIMPEVEGA